MSGFLLHLNATVLCTHGGQASPTAPNQRVLVSGNPISVFTTPYSVASCPNPGSSGGPCVSAQYVSSAARVFANFVPVLLFDSQAVCVSVGTLQTASTQTRVIGS